MMNCRPETRRAAAWLIVLVLTMSVLHAQSKKAAPSEDLNTLLAPIALYPDQLLAQMLMCATSPGDVVALNGWLATTTNLKGTALQDAATKTGFEPSFVAMSLFPQTVKMMADQLDWTTRLGQAFTANRSAVFNAIQRLRAQAQQTGTLKTNAQQEVETRTTSTGEEVIVIEPANPQVVYVPQYNPQVVYTQPPTSTTIVVQENNSSADAAAAGMIGFAAGIAIGAAIDNDYYYGPYGWHGGGYMYNDAWDDYYDHREDAREDWQDNREDMAEERSDRRENTQEERTDRQENRPEASQAQKDQARSKAETAKQDRQSGASASTQSRTASQESRGYGSGSAKASASERSGSSSGAFSGYSNGKSERSASSRGQRSRSSSRSSGGGGRRR
jgi:hypothetical protein